jgi:putative oxidoreductase
MDLGLLIIRLAVGLTFAAHGAQKLFGVFGGHGLSGTGAYMESLRFRPGRRHAEMAGATEVAAGLLFAAGLLTPLAAAGIIGVMVVAGTVAARRTFFLTAGGFEYPFILAAVAAGIAFTGPGFVSGDRLLDLDLRGPAWGCVGVLLGVAAGAAQLASRHSDDKPAEPVDLRHDDAMSRAETAAERREANTDR